MRCPQFSKATDGRDYCVVELCGSRTDCKGSITGCKDTYMRGLLEATMDVGRREKEAWFEERTAHHIDLVKKAAAKIAEANPEFKEFDGTELVMQADEHDASKLIAPEREPYIDLTWQHKQDNFKGYKTPGEIPNDAINKATLHHIRTNRHHPEYGLENEKGEVADASGMSNLDIAEMVADWQAMSEELKTNTARQWYDKQRNVRWKFTAEQEALIDKLLKVFETREPYHSMDPHDGIGEDDGW
jgi:hypothetical protein